MITVTGCEHQERGERRVYHLNDHSTVVESPLLPMSSASVFTTVATGLFMTGHHVQR